MKENNKIIVDSREDQKILLMLKKANIPYEVKALDVGDYVCGNTMFERKTIADFIQSMRGHLQEQLVNMTNNEEIKHVVVVLIGDYEDLFWKHIRVNQNQFYGMMASITMKYKVSILHFKRETQFINYLGKCLEKKDGEIDFTKIKRLQYKDNTELSVLCALPSISVNKAEKILENFDIKLSLLDKNTKTIIKNEEVFIESLKKIDGFGKKITSNLLKYFF